MTSLTSWTSVMFAIMVTAWMAHSQFVRPKDYGQANSMADRFFQFVRSDPKYDSVRIADIVVDFTSRFPTKVINGRISLKDGVMSGFGASAQRVGNTDTVVNNTKVNSTSTSYRCVIAGLFLKIDFADVEVKLLRVGDFVKITPEDVVELRKLIRVLKSQSIYVLESYFTAKVDNDGRMTIPSITVSVFRDMAYTDFMNVAKDGRSIHAIVPSLNNTNVQLREVALKSYTNKIVELMGEYNKHEAEKTAKTAVLT